MSVLKHRSHSNALKFNRIKHTGALNGTSYQLKRRKKIHPLLPTKKFREQKSAHLVGQLALMMRSLS